MSLKSLFHRTLQRINGSNLVRRELTAQTAQLIGHINHQTAEVMMTHINHQTADLMAHANHQTADLVASFQNAIKADEAMHEILRIVARSHRKLLGLDDLIIDVDTRNPVAHDSPDHVKPWGTGHDNSTNLRFNAKLANWIPPSLLNVLDLGCAGGGFVKSVLDMGCLAVGIEGSDYSKIRARAEWATIPEYLFTADITEPFCVVGGERSEPKLPLKFSVITAWEVIEHIRADQLPAVFRNIDSHLRADGVVILSVSPRADVVDNVAYHQTVEDRDWWLAQCSQYGFVHCDAVARYFGEDWVRGGPNTPDSFPLVLTRHNESLPSPLPAQDDPAPLNA